MKYLSILVISLSTFVSVAQQIVPLIERSTFDDDVDTSSYYKDIAGDLNKFLGTWTYQEGNKEFIVTFYLKTYDKNGLGDYSDRIYAKFKYTESGIVIYDTLDDTSVSAEMYISGSYFSNANPNILKLGYFEPTDIPYKVSLYQGLKIEYITCTGLSCNPQLTWKSTWINGGDPSDPYPFKIPNDIVLTKQ